IAFPHHDETPAPKGRGADRGGAGAAHAHERAAHIRAIGEVQCHGPAQANSNITASTARLSPGLALMVLTTPSRSARKTFSIFIASTTASASPALTSWPSTTAIASTRSGIAQRNALPLSAALFAGIRRAPAAS